MERKLDNDVKLRVSHHKNGFTGELRFNYLKNSLSYNSKVFECPTIAQLKIDVDAYIKVNKIAVKHSATATLLKYFWCIENIGTYASFELL